MKAEDPNWLRVARIYAAYGITAHLDIKTLPEGVVYAGGRVALAYDELELFGLGLHDLAHWMIASDARRNRENFGLGPFPSEAGEKKDVRRLVSVDAAWAEEAIASDLNVILADFYFGREVAEKTLGELNCERIRLHDPASIFETEEKANRRVARAAGRRMRERGFLAGRELRLIEVGRD